MWRRIWWKCKGLSREGVLYYVFKLKTCWLYEKSCLFLDDIDGMIQFHYGHVGFDAPFFVQSIIFAVIIYFIPSVALLQADSAVKNQATYTTPRVGQIVANRRIWPGPQWELERTVIWMFLRQEDDSIHQHIRNQTFPSYVAPWFLENLLNRPTPYDLLFHGHLIVTTEHYPVFCPSLWTETGSTRSLNGSN